MTFDIDDFLAKAKKAQASDIHIHCGKSPSLRINGVIYKIASSPIEYNDILNILDKTLPKEYRKNLEDAQDFDYIYELPSVARYRVNYCKDIYHGKFTFRSIPFKIKTLKELSLPSYLETFTRVNNGIVLVTGATGSGKSTTLASMIDIINNNYKKHIVTIEDPVEFVYEEKKSIVTQRSLDIDVKDFKTGIKYALRQDPDVILVGEIRDRATLLSAIEAAETGHLVFSTIHTNGTVPSIDRLKGLIDENAQKEFIKRLAHCIRGIVHQQLVPTVKNGQLTPAVEILTFTSTVVDYVKDEKLNEVSLLMQRSTQPNLSTMNSSLFALYKKGIITKETAFEYSLEKVEMDQMLRGIYRNSSQEETLL